MANGFLVTETIDGAHPKISNYPLLKDDLIVPREDGSFMKESPGIAIGGFRLTDEQKATLKEVQYTAHGLRYHVQE